MCVGLQLIELVFVAHGYYETCAMFLGRECDDRFHHPGEYLASEIMQYLLLELFLGESFN